jgi:hypothetical protein
MKHNIPLKKGGNRGSFFLRMEIACNPLRSSLVPAKETNNCNKYYTTDYGYNNIP